MHPSESSASFPLPPPNPCIFCGEPAKTKEDAWPKWLTKLLRKHPKEKVPLKEFGSNRPNITRITASDEVIRIGCVCGSCNSGWMKDMEDKAAPILTPMIRGNSAELGTREQLIIASWLTKCAMVFMAQVPKEKRFYDSLDGLHFMKHNMPFNSTNIWLGRYATSKDLRGVTDYDSFPVKAADGGQMKCHAHTMAFGFLAMQIVCIKRLEHKPHAWEDGIPFMLNLPWSDLTVQTWPSPLRAVHWPPTLSFDDAERHLKFFVKRFSPRDKR